MAGRITAAFGFGLISLFFSEFFFLNEGPVEAVLTKAESGGLVSYLASFGALYAAFAYVILVVIWGFGLTTWPGLILAGALLGWCIEAVVIPLAYEAPPLSFAWPSLGWHLIVVFGIGWLGIRHAMREWSGPKLATLFITLGFVWPAWGRLFAAEDPALRLPVGPDWVSFVTIIGIVWLAGVWLSDRPWARFSPTRWDFGLAGLLLVPLFVMTAASAGVWGLALGGLVTVTLAAAWHLGSGTSAISVAPRSDRYAVAMLLPFSAILGGAVYPPFPSGWSFVVTLPLTALGTGALCWALWRTVRHS